MIEQTAISVLSIASIGLAYWPQKDLRIWGAACGLLAQPLWIYLVFSKGLWGIAPLTPVYTIMYIVAFRAHWRKHAVTQGP